MSTGLVDAERVSLVVKEYFEKTHGVFSVWEFRIEKAYHPEDSDSWIVQCSFRPHINSPARNHYEVLLSPEGNIVQVEMKGTESFQSV